jgi:hypothetical protein
MKKIPPPWGDDMESALITQDRVLRLRVNAASSPHAARTVRPGIVFVICATAPLSVLLTLLLISSASCNGNNTNSPTPKNLVYGSAIAEIKQIQTGEALSIRKVR